MSRVRAEKISRVKRGRGSLMLRPEVKRLIDEAAGRVGQNRNEFVDRLLRWWLAQPTAVRLWSLGLLADSEIVPLERVEELLNSLATEVSTARRIPDPHGAAGH